MADDDKYPGKFAVKNNGRAIENAIKHCGSQAELARTLRESAGVKCYAQKVNEWRLRGIIPPYWVKHIAKVLKVDPSDLDPLLYDAGEAS